MKTKWIPALQVAKMHNMSRELLLYYVKKGTGPEGEQLGRYWYFPLEEAERWEKPERKNSSGKT